MSSILSGSVDQGQEDAGTVDFEVDATAATARVGRLEVAGTTFETPNLFPVVNFYAGGTQNSLFGGGVHRTMKEFMAGHEVVSGGDYTEYFDGVMTSVASLTDYNITEERYNSYMEVPIKERDEFTDFDGVLFVDSGGFKFLYDGELDGSDFQVEIDQKTAFDIQRQLGANIIVNLDRPIEPDDNYEERVRKARKTGENAAEFLRLSYDYDAARYLTVHGYNYSMVDSFLNEIVDILGETIAHNAFDGIALGGLVPKKDNKDALITAVSECQQVLDDRGFGDMPFHVLGISNSAMPLLIALGVDTFDSSAYLHGAINGKYYESLLKSTRFDDVDFAACDCPVCTNPELVDRMQGNAEYQKDILGPVAMHNLIVQKREITELREIISEEGTDGLVRYIDQTVARRDRTRKAAHRVVNEFLGGYF